MNSQTDPRIQAFCSFEQSELFHAIAHRHEIWHPDPFDVEEIHQDARRSFKLMVARATTPPGLSSGRLLLLLGEAGCGKTHLMRAYRNWVHSTKAGYCGYMQMTSSSEQYARYVLNNLIDSLNQTYYEPEGPMTGLMRLSTALAECRGDADADLIRQIREGDFDLNVLGDLVDQLTDRIIVDDRFNDVDSDLARALLYLQHDDARIRNKVLKYLRCESMSPRDRQTLGQISPRSYDTAPERMIELLGKLIWATNNACLVLCVDQLEGMYNLEDAQARFRRMMWTLCNLADQVPSVIIVIACLEDFYQDLKKNLTQSMLDRIEQDPRWIRLTSARTGDEAVRVVSKRLEALYNSTDAKYRADQPTFPIGLDDVKNLAGQRTRGILSLCGQYRDRCMEANAIVSPFILDGDTITPPPPLLEALWNDFRTSFKGSQLEEESQLAELLAWAIVTSSEELQTGHRFEAVPNGRMIAITQHDANGATETLLGGVCNRGAKGGGLGAQITELAAAAGASLSIIIRSSPFPTTVTSVVYKQIQELEGKGSRKAVVEDTDWRTIQAIKTFREKHASRSDFRSWLKIEKPLTQLKSIHDILGLSKLKPPSSTNPNPPISPPPTPGPSDLVADGNGTQGGVSPPPPPPLPPPPSPPPISPDPQPVVSLEREPIALGVGRDRSASAITIGPDEFTRHAVFLGSTGSGKTTLALNVVEQLVIQGIPAILIDRKGDLAAYADPDALSQGATTPELQARLARFRDRADIALYTPGNPKGRPLSIAVAPRDLGRMSDFDRQQTSKLAANALAGMMGYGPRSKPDNAKLAILAQAIEELAHCEPDLTITVDNLARFIHEQDSALLDRISLLDPKHLPNLVNDLETMRLSRGGLLSAQGEPLEAESLFGLGESAKAGKTRLSIVSVKFLGADPDIQFWVSHLLMELSRWASRSPAKALQGVVMFDEADLYLPAVGKPATKEPMEHLLKRARSAGLGVLLASQNVGDFDYKARENMRTWFLGVIRETNSIGKLKPVLNGCKVDVAAKLPSQGQGEFYLARDGEALSMKAHRSLLATEQLPEDRILELAAQTRPAAPR